MSEVLESFERYRGIIPDFEGFAEAVDAARPTDLRINRLEADPDRALEALREAGYRPETFEWAPDHVRLPGLEGPGRAVEYQLGRLHAQGLTSAVPPLVLDPRPGEWILDLCGAPGSKTTQIAALTGNRAALVANDKHKGRAGLLVAQANRLGALCAVTAAPGESYPGSIVFDRVLVDAPCTGQGTVREPREEDHWAGPSDREAMHAIQVQLLVRACRLVKRDGVVVYSTCSYAPEENEAVVAEVLEREPDLEVEPLPDAIPHEPGLTSFGGEAFGESLRRAGRFYPHHQGSYGFFCCRIRRRDGPPGEEAGPPVPPGATGPAISGNVESAERGLFYLESRFGIAREALAPYRLEGARRSVWLVPRVLDTSRIEGAHRLAAWGLRFLKIDPNQVEKGSLTAVKPTTAALGLLDPHVERSVVRVDGKGLWTWLRGEKAPYEWLGEGEPTPGFVHIRCGDEPVGCGLLGRSGLSSQCPGVIRDETSIALWMPGPGRG